MKTNSLIILSILLIFTSCINDETKNTEKALVEFKKSEINGEWNRTDISEIEDENELDRSVRKINFKDDFTADIEVLDSGKYKTVTGSWEINGEKSIGPKKMNFSIEADIILTVVRNDSDREIIGLSVEKRDNKKVLRYSKNSIFEKQ